MLAVVRSTMSEKVILRPKEVKQIIGYADRVIDYQTSTVMIQDSKEGQLPSDVDITPAVFQHHHAVKPKGIKVTVSNVSTNTVLSTSETKERDII